MLRVLGALVGSLAVLLAIAALVFVVVVFFSESQTTFRCEGNLTIQAQTRPATLFMTLTKFRWWVMLWSESEGMVSIEAPKEGIGYRPYLGLHSVRDTIHIFHSDSDIEVGDRMGAYYRLSRHLKLYTPRGFFEGDCIPIKKDF